jgi:hypothetical protein
LHQSALYPSSPDLISLPKPLDPTKIKPMNKYWSLRKEFYQALHRWPSMLLFFGVGSILGLAIAFIWPSNYRATSQIFIALNPYRAFEDAHFLALTKPKYQNIDNYHYWQMSQLEGAIYLDEILQETLTELRQSDPYWESVTVEQLSDMLDAEWRSAGKWELVAKDRDPQHAAEASETWGKVIIKRIRSAVLSAQDAFMIDQDLQEIAKQKLGTNLRIQQLTDTKLSILEWQAAARDLPKGQPLDSSQRWQVLALASQSAQFTPLWMATLEEQPVSDAPLEVYVTWNEKLVSVIDEELATLEKQLVSLEQQHSNLQKEYSTTFDQSLGMSPNIEIEALKSLPAKAIRQTSTFALIGGAISLLIWVLTQLVIITNREQSQ